MTKKIDIRPRQKTFALIPALGLVAAFLLFAAVAATTRVGAQDMANGEPEVVRNEDLELKVEAGFGRLEVNGRTGSWVPFRVTLANQGPAINGRLVVQTKSSNDPNQPMRDFIKQINLPTGSQQTLEIAAFLNSAERPLVQVINDDGTVVAQVSLNVERTFGMSGQLEIAVVDNDKTALNNIAATQVIRPQGREPFKSVRASAPQQAVNPSEQFAQAPPAPGPPGGRGRQMGPNQGRQILEAHPTAIKPESLPRDFISYDPVDVVVIGEAPMNQLTQEQSRALKLWVASGGLLIVTGGADMAGINSTGLQDILPVEAQSVSSASPASLPEIADVYGPLESAGGLTVMSTIAKPDARVLIGSADRPLVAERSYGSGLVRFLAINPKLNPYRGWIPAKELWSDLLLPAADKKERNVNWVTFGGRGRAASNRWGLQNYLFRLAEVEPPSPKFVLLFLLVYVVTVGPINYFALRWKRKTDLAWLTIPSVVILFTIVSVAVAQVSRGSKSVIADVSLVELHQRDGISRTLGGLLIMPASKGTQEVTFANRDSYVNDAINANQSSSASATGTIQSERTQSELTMRLPMTTWTSGLFQIRSESENAKPVVSATETAASTVSIRNLSGAQLTKAVYISAAGVSDMFDLAPGAEQKITLTSPQQIPFNQWYAGLLGNESEEGGVFADLAFLLDRQIGGDRAFMQDISQGFFEFQKLNEASKKLDRPILVCFSDSEASEIKFENSFKHNSKAFYVIHL